MENILVPEEVFNNEMCDRDYKQVNPSVQRWLDKHHPGFVLDDNFHYEMGRTSFLAIKVRNEEGFSEEQYEKLVGPLPYIDHNMLHAVGKSGKVEMFPETGNISMMVSGNAYQKKGHIIKKVHVRCNTHQLITMSEKEILQQNRQTIVNDMIKKMPKIHETINKLNKPAGIGLKSEKEIYAYYNLGSLTETQKSFGYFMIVQKGQKVTRESIEKGIDDYLARN